jgi:hypothetical protein
VPRNNFSISVLPEREFLLTPGPDLHPPFEVSSHFGQSFPFEPIILRNLPASFEPPSKNTGTSGVTKHQADSDLLDVLTIGIALDEHAYELSASALGKRIEFSRWICI